MERKEHWENIYNTKEHKDVSWFETTPQTSLDLIQKFKLPLDAYIIDIGGGDSFLVDHLLELGYLNVSVLDISEAALERAQARLGEKAEEVTWIISDVSSFSPERHYDLWHDRAAFHFLTDEYEISNYLKTADRALKEDGKLLVGTFSKKGPTKCSGIEIKQYSESSMTDRFSDYFEKIECLSFDHKTPFDTIQNFVFCSFQKV
ncbi:MAG: class I SAM-dependent methyltransferase [Chitinophagales bacterium]|nr:class I SAM-dependent methyltransferase [Chitinophagales bacterium]